MRILLATYNFFPFHFGGSEVYVHSLAKYLQSAGHHPVIIAASPEKAFEGHPSFFQDQNMKICRYDYDGLTIWGVQYKHYFTDIIYSKKSAAYKKSWMRFFAKQNSFDLLHINGFTSAIGLDLFEAVKETNPQIKIISSYHTAISCAKGNLVYSYNNQECCVTINADVCTTCFITEKASLPFGVSKMITRLLPKTKIPGMPSFINTKSLINSSVESFFELNNLTDQWITYSEGIKNVLIKNNVYAEKIFFIRHGISSNFIKQAVSERPSGEMRFLFSGRLVKIKGFQTLLKAWLSLPQSEDKCLWITALPEADDPEAQRLLHQAEKRNDIRFLGPLNQTELIDTYKQVHCVIIPSEVFEIGPLVFHEAIALGCKVIASDIGGCRELGNHYKKESTLFQFGNEASLAAAIKNFRYNAPANYPVLGSEEHNRQILAQFLKVTCNGSKAE